MVSVYIVTKQNKFYCDVAGSSSTITYAIPIPLYNNTYTGHYVETTISSVNGSTTFTDYTNYDNKWGLLGVNGFNRNVCVLFDRAINFSSYPTTDNIVSKINLYSDSAYTNLIASSEYDFSITYVNHDSATNVVASYDFSTSVSGWTASVLETFSGVAPTLTPYVNSNIYYSGSSSLSVEVSTSALNGFLGTISIVSPSISFTTASSGTYYLSFAYIQEYEALYQTPKASFVSVDYSTDGGTTWHKLTDLINTYPVNNPYYKKWLYVTYPLPLPASTSVNLQVRINIVAKFGKRETLTEPFLIDDVWIFLQ